MSVGGEKLSIVNVIKADIAKKSNKYIARKYYNYKPKASPERISFVDRNGRTCSLDEKDERMYTNYFKLIVNQKIDYLLAKEPSLKTNKLFSTVKIVDVLEDLMLGASLDTTSWLQFVIEDGKLEWLLVPDKEIIPIYDRYHKKLIEAIKYFLIDKDTFHVEHWTLDGVKIFQIHKEKVMDVTTQAHYEVKTYYEEDEIAARDSANFKTIPFIPFYNNKARVSDLDGLRGLLDMYNAISTGFVENISVFQEFLMKLKGFAANTATLDETMRNMKKYKVVSLPGDADADYMKVEIPVEARRVLLEILKENIFMVGQAMDPTVIGDGNLTNIVIQSRYAALDMKANRTEKQLKVFYEKFAEFVTNFYNVAYDNSIICNRSMLFNVTETIKNCLDSMKILSLETVIDNHPWPASTKEELKRLQKEKETALAERKKEMESTSSSGDENDETNLEKTETTDNNDQE